MATQNERDLLELEIGAFMGPHIQRARIALVLIGALFLLSAYLNYSDIAAMKKALSGLSDSDPQFGDLKYRVDHAFILVVFTGIAGAVNIVLAAIAGKLTTFAIYTAGAIFAAHSIYRLYLGAAIFMDW